MTTSFATALPPDAQAVDGDERPPRAARWALIFLVLSVTVLSRFGLRAGSHPVDSSFFALWALLAVLLWRGWARFDAPAFVWYGLAVAAGVASTLVNTAFSSALVSPSSLALLVVIYLPFAFTLHLPGDPQAAWRWTLRTFGNVALVVALAGIVQFYAQYAIAEPWLFKFPIPWRLQGPEGYNTVIPVGDLFKSNGFFMREPSYFSFLMAMAILLEIDGARRWLRVAVFGFALLLTYSGTGLLALAVGLMVPPGRRTLVTLFAAVAGGLLVVWVLGDALNLQFTLNRVAEFGSERSSAYARYVAPALRIAEEGADPWWAVLVGHGPGTMQRMTRAIASHDPTWAKLLFEYGLLGFVSMTALVGWRLARVAAPASLRVVLFVGWFVMGGHLLSPEYGAMLYLLLCGWPAARAEAGAASDEGAWARIAASSARPRSFQS